LVILIETETTLVNNCRKTNIYCFSAGKLQFLSGGTFLAPFCTYSIILVSLSEEYLHKCQQPAKFPVRQSHKYRPYVGGLYVGGYDD